MDRTDASVESSSVADSISSKRLRRPNSPTKRMVDLVVANKPVVPGSISSLLDVPKPVLELYKEVYRLANFPRGIVPAGIEV